MHKLTAILYNSASSLIGACSRYLLSFKKILKAMIFCITSVSAFDIFT